MCRYLIDFLRMLFIFVYVYCVVVYILKLILVLGLIDFLGWMVENRVNICKLRYYYIWDISWGWYNLIVDSGVCVGLW